MVDSQLLEGDSLSLTERREVNIGLSKRRNAVRGVLITEVAVEGSCRFLLKLRFFKDGRRMNGWVNTVECRDRKGTPLGLVAMIAF